MSFQIVSLAAITKKSKSMVSSLEIVEISLRRKSKSIKKKKRIKNGLIHVET